MKRLKSIWIFKGEIEKMKSKKLNEEKEIMLNSQKYKEGITEMKSEKLNEEEQILLKNNLDNNQSKKEKEKTKTKTEADNYNNEEQLESLVISAGIELSKLKSLAKCIDIVVDYDDEINFNQNDIENLVIILKNMIDETSEQFEKIEKHLNI